ncbi:MAG: NFACT family protein [Chloroflexi bacterium]|nr:NFACT family protein [Chloroflexota bacterium]
MNIDVATLTALRREFTEKIVGGRIQRVLHPDNLAVALEIYAFGETWWLIINAAPQAPRLYLTHERPARMDDNVTPLLLLLRKYVRNGRLIAVEQPPWERVLQFTVHARVDEDIVETTLIAEIMGRTSNLVLVDADGVVLDSMKRVDASINRYRQVKPKLLYVPPPPLSRPDPFTAEASLLEAAAQAEPKQPAWRVLMGQTSGCGPLIAREAVYRAAGEAVAPAADVVWQEVLDAAQGIFTQVDSGELAPSLARQEDGALAAYAPYALTMFPQCETLDLMSGAIEQFYREQGNAPQRQTRDLGQKPLQIALKERMDQLRQRRRALERQEAEATDAEEWRRKGDLVLAYGYSVAPGSSEIEVDDETIRIDPQESVAANADTYFAAYKRKKRAQEEVPGLLRRVKNEYAYCEQMEALLEAAETPTDVRAVRDELREQGIMGGGQERKTKKLQSKKRGKGKRGRQVDAGAQPVSFWLDGVQVLVGRSGAQNDAALRLADANDLWLHARNVPGAHTLLRSGGRDVPEVIIEQAAQIAAYYSKLRESTSAEVDVTRRRYVRRIPRSPPGLVTYRNEYTIRVKPEPIPQPER